MADDLLRTLYAIAGVTACAHCGALMPRIPDDDGHPVMKVLGRLCEVCYQHQEKAR